MRFTVAFADDVTPYKLSPTTTPGFEVFANHLVNEFSLEKVRQ